MTDRRHADLGLTPTGRLVLQGGPSGMEGEGPFLDVSFLDRVRGHFEAGTAEGLLHVALQGQGASLPPVWAYWRDLAGRYLTTLCHVPETTDGPLQPLLPPADELRLFAQSAPPMRGGEYLSAETLQVLWGELDALVRAEVQATKGGLSAWLKDHSPLWHRVGRVCFHLAENKRDADCPFAFLATYAPMLSASGRLQYQPLGMALQEYAGARNRPALVRLLSPVQRAAERLAWVKALVDSGDVFHPLRWAPRDAWQFLRDIPALEESGLIVRMPDWWTKIPPRVRVSVSLGGKPKTALGMDALLDFQVGLALDGQTLSQEEWQQILHSQDGLVFLKGRWVEVDRQKLRAALDLWKQVESQVGDGISFLEGMRLLAGAPLGEDQAGLLDTQTDDWATVRAGPWLEERLRALREPAATDAALPGAEFRATLRPYQQVGVQWLQLLSNLGLGACLADDMGLGKTIQVIALLLMLKKRGTPRPSLLVVPASVLVNWKAEIERFAPSLCVRFLHPSQMENGTLPTNASQGARFVVKADAVLTTYSMVPRLPWLAETDWALAVLDEAQFIKNPAARQTREVKKLKAAARIALTGTPVENRLGDLWSIFDFVCPGLLGSAQTFRQFVKRLEARPEAKYAPLRRLVAPYLLRRLKTDKAVIADLPEKTEVQAFCTLSKAQAVLYEQSVRELATILKTVAGIERRGVVLAFLMRLKQICNHPDQWLGRATYAPADSGKFARLRELAEEMASRQQKALVFSQFREMTQPLERFLAGVFGRGGAVLHGATPVGKRKALVDDFQREDGPPFFVLSLKAGGIGLNLTAAANVVHFDRWWNPAVENQATDRAFRIGQKRNVMVHKFVCQGTVEERIDRLLRDKTNLAEEILEGGTPAALTEMSDKELLDLVRLDVNTVQEE